MGKKKITVEELILQYISTMIEDLGDVSVEIIEDIPVIVKEGLWHIYVMETGIRGIGCFLDDDVRIYQEIKRLAPGILDIYSKNKE